MVLCLFAGCVTMSATSTSCAGVLGTSTSCVEAFGMATFGAFGELVDSGGFAAGRVGSEMFVGVAAMFADSVS